MERPAEDWGLERCLDWLTQLHPQSIDLGLERIRIVWQRMALPLEGVRILSVAGTNGKGSCVAVAEALALAKSQRVGAYTSPHLYRYNERIRIDGEPVSDEAIVQAFVQVDMARADVSLSYFEFGTLAAFWIFAQAKLDLWILEVGLGGRLDAVNLLDADLSILSSVGLDHADYLGSDLEQIAAEKLAIGRPGKTVLIGPDVPASTASKAHDMGLIPHCVDIEGDYRLARDGAFWRIESGRLAELVGCVFSASLLASNVVLAAMAIEELLGLPAPAQCHKALRNLAVPGRCEHRRDEQGEWILDVGHNPAAVSILKSYLKSLPEVPVTIAVFSALSDKPVDQMMALLNAEIDVWHLAPLSGDRALNLEQLQARLPAGAKQKSFPSIRDAFGAARETGARVVVFGSFFCVAEVGRG